MHRVESFFREKSLTGLCVVSPEGRLLRVNNRCCEIWQRSEEELLSLTFQEFTYPEDLAPDVNNYRRVMDPDDPLTTYTMDKRYLLPLGGFIWCTLFVQGYYNEDGTLAYFLSEILEISDRRLSDQDHHQLQQIKTGLQNNDFTLHYQPIVDLANDQVVGYEALSRWQYAGKVLTPDKFIPLLQATHQVHLLCHSVIEQAVSVQNKFAEQGKWISINVSPLTIARDDWGDYAPKLPSGIHMEVLEDAEVSNKTEARLQELSQQGVVLAIDDFGTGYSTFQILDIIGIQALKIDASLTCGLGQRGEVNARQEKRFRAVMAMAKDLGLVTIAEGIENKSQELVARSLGCDYGQGYYWSEAVPWEELAA